jgi:hypothetical protein
MTKDEAWKAHVEGYDRDRFDSTSRHRRHCFDAGWEAALADTLGMLEELAKLQDSVVIYLHDGQTALEVWQHKGPGMEFRYQKQGRITPCHEENISRAEVLALLGDHPHG